MAADELAEELYEAKNIAIFIPVEGVDTVGRVSCFCSECLHVKTTKGANMEREKKLQCPVCGRRTRFSLTAASPKQISALG